MKTQSTNNTFELGLESYGQNDNFQHFGYFQWYKMMAARGYSRAQYALAKCYQNGYGVAKNETEAQRWFALADKSDTALGVDSTQAHTLSMI